MAPPSRCRCGHRATSARAAAYFPLQVRRRLGRRFQLLSGLSLAGQFVTFAWTERDRGLDVDLPWTRQRGRLDRTDVSYMWRIR
jgi:hypothetical protein